ncbi:uncharacterized protein LOC105700051 isoform X1 [Orussus abietinus]|uniref:uncharacterized protein LOC105700051 isoform X1 n=1 Tax=Orussus abietinus TaxID=222816 RepID=UPI00062692CC|nr:uncharacterized protein LOC105700051 isoform X1 [Orussus abietinus]XP_023290612.1 uncharacterized protein LOC105700051 isoform X1 [Orussus abietinus]
MGVMFENGLQECCKAVTKRQVDGDEFLHLTEGKLLLWKSDLSRPQIWSLWTFVEEVKKCPEKYLEDKTDQQINEELKSAIASPGMGLEDKSNENVTQFRSNSMIPSKVLQREDQAFKQHIVNEKNLTCPNSEENCMYANSESKVGDENIYSNVEVDIESKKSSMEMRTKNMMILAKELREQLNLRETVKLKTETVLKKPASPPLETKQNNEPLQHSEFNERTLPKPPAIIRNLDLVANLPTRMEESEDDYESFDEQIVQQHRQGNVLKDENRHSLAGSFQSSMDSVYHPPSTTSQEEEEYEIYESITEVGDDDEYYLRPISRVKPVDVPPPLPDKLPSTPSPVPSIKASEKKADRSREKKFATLPNSGDESSGRSERASRPLPPPPDRLTYLDKPWFHNVTRNQAAALIKGQTSRGVPRDGYFLLRPSYSNPSNPLTLVVWCKDRVYNIPVRKRADNWYALGSEKSKEPVFASVEEIVSVYSREELLLDSEGVRTESTKLTETPSK